MANCEFIWTGKTKELRDGTTRHLRTNATLRKYQGLLTSIDPSQAHGNGKQLSILDDAFSCDDDLTFRSVVNKSLSVLDLRRMLQSIGFGTSVAP